MNDKQKTILKKAFKAFLYSAITFILAAIPVVVTQDPVLFGLAIPIAPVVRGAVEVWNQYKESEKAPY